MQPDLVSIVIPCYNDDPDHLNQSVTSALNQRHTQIEVIVVDDGSTRFETIKAVESLRGVTVVRRDNGGTGSALNTGIRASSGAYVLPLGADDHISEDFVGSTVKTLEGATPDVVAVYPTVQFIGERVGTAEQPSSVQLGDIIVRNRIVACALYRRVDWERVGGYGEFDDCSEDWFFWAKLLGRPRAHMVLEPRAQFYYRIRPGSRNSVNRSAERKRNARRHIAAALSEQLTDMYLAAAEQADDAIAQAERYGAFVEGWRNRLGPAYRAYKYLQEAKNTSRVR